MRLSRRISDQGLSPAVARAFANGLHEVAAVDGYVNDVEQQLISRLIDGGLRDERQDAAPFEALWSCAELFLSACITVAVSDGAYGVEEARLISLYAHRLGYSVRRLSALESQMFADLNARAQAIDEESPTTPRRHPKKTARENTSTWLRDSDSEMVERYRRLRREER
jgi:tellurite resistance protein